MKANFRFWSVLILIAMAWAVGYGREERRPVQEQTGLAVSGPKKGTIQALTPDDENGYQFVSYGDSCSGGIIPIHERNFAAVNSVLARLAPKPEFICFLGDNIVGNTTDGHSLRRQWRYWLDKEMAWLDRSIPLYQMASNHNTYDDQSENIFREIFPGIPDNGPADQKGLSYFVRQRDLLLVFVNTAAGLDPPQAGPRLRHWLDGVLRENQDARFKLVFGHYPVLPVNGYEQGGWVVNPREGEPIWDILVRHSVSAYICSHIIAFDVRVKQGVLQILTGGAGSHAGPGGYMPGQTEYLHLVQMALDLKGLRYQVIDDSGLIRESLSWPLLLPSTDSWSPFLRDGVSGFQGLRESQDKKRPEANEQRIMLIRFTGQYPAAASGSEQTFLCGSDPGEGPPTLWAGLDASSRLTVCLVPVPGGGSQVWKGPSLSPEEPFEVQLAIHTGMGPGGVMWRARQGDPWSSLETSSSRGAENTSWPTQWWIGKSNGQKNDKAFRGKDLNVTWKLIQAKSVR